MLDFEEEYQLISSAKELNDRNIEDTLASLKSMGARRQAPVPAANTYQHQAVPQQQQYRQPVVQQVQQPVQQSATPQQSIQYVQPAPQEVQTVQTVQPAQQVQTDAATSQNSEESLEMYTDKK
jgi:FtsZ-interacting cell division protein ZipA